MSDDKDSDGTMLYVRFRGRVQGPYDRSQLQTLARRGKFTRLHEVSTDGQDWERATNHPELFAPTESTKSRAEHESYELEESVEPASAPPQAPSSSGAQWHYTSGPEKHGPVDFPQLRFLVNAGQVTADDLVWKEGMPDWAPVSQIPGLLPSALQAGATRDSGERRIEAQDPPRVSGLAVASMVLGILWIFGIGSVLAIIFGGVAMYQIRRSRGQLFGTGMAVAGLTLGIVFLGLQLTAWIMAMAESEEPFNFF